MTRRTKPRLFSFSREVEIANFEEVVTDAEERRALVAIVDAFLEVCRTQAVSEAALRTLTSGARSRWAYVRGVAVTRLTVLTHYFPEAQGQMEALATDPDEEVRLYACAALPNTPDSVAVPLLAAALRDPAWRVRKAAATACSALAMPSLVPVLQERLEAETDARVRVQVQLAADFQRTR